MKIAFTGSHCTGKSTLAKLMSIELNLPRISNVCSSYYKSANIDNFERLTRSERGFHQKMLTRLQILVESKHTHFISDRSGIDYLAYSILQTDLPLADKLMLSKTIEKQAMGYDYLFYCPIEFTFEERELRGSKDTQEQIDECIQYLLFSLNVPHLVLSGTISERINQIRAVI